MLVPVEQETILFHDKPIVAVKLPDGRIGVVLRWICENLQLLSQGQIARIKRTEVIADDLQRCPEGLIYDTLAA